MPTSGNTILKSEFNTAQAKLQDILGLGDNGYGISVTFSDPVETTQLVSAKQWNRLINDVNIIHTHITNTGTNTSALVTGSPVKASTTTALISRVDWLNDDSRRYTCHPSQFFSTGTSLLTSTSTFYSDSTSTRTIAWGINPSIITHQVIATFTSRLSARYYFNIGSYLKFIPYYEGNILADMDAYWANFIDYLANHTELDFIYNRSKFVNYTSTTTSWSSGTLSISVLAEKSVDERTITFTTTYGNSDTSNVYIVPSGSTYNQILI